jgi:hypothetical protein
MTDASRTRGVCCASRSQSHETWQYAPARLVYKGNSHTWHRTADDTTGHREGVVTTGEKSRGLGKGSLMEGIQQLVVGSSISPIRLEKRLPLPSMPAH